MYQNTTARNALCIIQIYAGQLTWWVHKGQDAIIDFKQTNKPKRREWIESIVCS